MAGNLANLQKATAARTAAATARAEAALTAMIKAGAPVTFRGLAARGGSPWTSSTPIRKLEGCADGWSDPATCRRPVTMPRR